MSAAANTRGERAWADHAARRPSFLIARAVLLETVRRREVYVLFLLMAIFVAGAIVVRFTRSDSAATARFALNLGLTLAFWCGKILALLTAMRQMPNELENRTILPLMAKPVGRGHLLAGKIAAAWTAGLIATALLGVIAWLPVPKLETYSWATLGQTLLLQFIALGVISSGAVCLSLVVPRGVNVVIFVLLAFTGGTIATFLRARAHSIAATGGGSGSIWNWVAAYIPDFSRFDLISDYTDGLAPLNAAGFAARAGYGVAWIAVFALLAYAIFARRPLQ